MYIPSLGYHHSYYIKNVTFVRFVDIYIHVIIATMS